MPYIQHPWDAFYSLFGQSFSFKLMGDVLYTFQSMNNSNIYMGDGLDNRDDDFSA